MTIIETIVVSSLAASVVSFMFLQVGQTLQRRQREEQKEAEAWREIGEPVVHAADDLVGRLFDIMIRDRRLDMNVPLSEDVETRDTTKTFYDPPTELTTVWRMARYLASANFLEQHAADYGHVEEIRFLRFYAANKVRMGLKGNIYDADFKLQTEGQHVIGGKILSLAPGGRVEQPTFYHYLVGFREDSDVRDVSDGCRRWLDFDADPKTLSEDFATVAMTCIYLIDLVQDLRPTSKWEEFRLFLVRVLREKNRLTPGRDGFLYSRGDLSTDNYFDTFNVLSRDRERSWKFWQSPEDARKERIDNRQSEAFGREISKKGVTREKGGTEYVLSYQDSAEELHADLERMFG